MNGKVDIVKVGIGSGSCCTTRKQTGIGMPQFSAIIECADTAHGLDAHIISDGGLQVVGDFSKAYGAGADFVMSGSMFAGHTESGGELVEHDNGKRYKIFYGMSSSTAMNKYSGGVANYRSSEGKTVKIEYRGDVVNTILDIQGGIRSTMTYIGAKKIKDIPKCASFIRVNRQLNQIYNGKEL
jgi:GMP reductase